MNGTSRVATSARRVQKLETVNLRQDHVGHDHVRSGAARFLQRLFAVAALAHVVALRPQRHGVHLPLVQRGVDEKDTLDAGAAHRLQVHLLPRRSLPVRREGGRAFRICVWQRAVVAASRHSRSWVIRARCCSDGPAKVVESLDQQLELLAPAPAASKATVERREPRLDAVDETCAGFELSREVIELRLLAVATV